MKTESVRARIDPLVKAKAESVIHDLGLTPSIVIQMLYKQIIFTKSLPFQIAIPNAETSAALDELDNGNGIEATSVKAMLADLKGEARCPERSDIRRSSRKITEEQ